MTDETTAKPSRRGVITMGLAAAGGAAVSAPGALAASPQQGRSAAVVAGRRFRGWVSRGTRPSRTTLEELMFTIGGRTHHAGPAGGCSPMRDIPRFVAMPDRGQYDAKALATTVVPIERMREAYEEVVYRTTATAIMTA